MTTKTPIHQSSGNVFADLGVENPNEYLAKAELAAKVFQIVQKRHLNQTEAGELLGITQPKVSAMLNGRLDGFSTVRLFRFLNKPGCDVQIKVSKAHPGGRGRVLVLAG